MYHDFKWSQICENLESFCVLIIDAGLPPGFLELPILKKKCKFINENTKYLASNRLIYWSFSVVKPTFSVDQVGKFYIFKIWKIIEKFFFKERF